MSSESKPAEGEQGQSCSPPPEGTPCWIEIPAQDVEAVKTFYSSLFPSWDFIPEKAENNGVEVAMYKFTRPKGFGGGIVKMPAECKEAKMDMGKGFTVYYFVDSIDKTKARIEELGGKECLAKTPQGEMGWFANYWDIEGNRFGIYELAPSCGGQSSSS